MIAALDPKTSILASLDTIRRASPSLLDIDRFSEVAALGATFGTEQFDADLYLDGVIEKPWGHEYRVYADHFYDIWKLALLPGQATSMHCHPRKETALLCLSGHAEVQLLDRTHRLSATDFIYIHKGAFHSTRNIGNSDLHLIEVETPRNKFDLVRLGDRYGRVLKHYEQGNLDHHVPDIQPFKYINGAKLRPGSSDNLYSFGLRAGLDLICRRESNLIFLVSLSLKNAFKQDIQVFQASNMTGDALDPEVFYFTIAV